MLVMDSGLGGISVVRALRSLQPTLALHYLADTGGFPYGKRAPEAIAARAIALLETLQVEQNYAGVVLACNTLSTLCLDTLRAQFRCPFVGTVPAVKVAATRAKRFTLLATPNTADSAYSRGLIHEFAGHCVVDRVAAPNLAMMAERALLGEPVDPQMLAVEIAPAFRDDEAGRTQAVVLGCTHYPLLLDALSAAAPWEVQWIDSSEAIAKRALDQCGFSTLSVDKAIITSGRDSDAYAKAFLREGFGALTRLEHSLGVDNAA